MSEKYCVNCVHSMKGDYVSSCAHRKNSYIDLVDGTKEKQISQYLLRSLLSYNTKEVCTSEGNWYEEEESLLNKEQEGLREDAKKSIPSLMTYLNELIIGDIPDEKTLGEMLLLDESITVIDDFSFKGEMSKKVRIGETNLTLTVTLDVQREGSEYWKIKPV